jgi:two-component system, chemotaxis family, CheB/CheR fusion protein
LAPNQVFVAPPGAALGVHGGRLQLLPLDGDRHARPHVIDRFMTELAADQRERAIAIVLTGTDGDGALGVKAIKSEGGLVLAQLPSSAAHRGMPDSAVATGLVDRQLTIDEIAPTLVKYVHSAALHGLDAAPAADDLARVLDALQRQTTLDFHGYKQPMLQRRVRRRMALAHRERIGDYLALLDESRAECDVLADDFLISVTEFFREPDAWQVLAQEVVPSLLEPKHNGDTVRVWVPGCATGEEAYSIAMVLLDDPRLSERRLKLQVFATDLDGSALDVARRGVYPKTIEASVGARRLARYFTLRSDQYQVGKPLRDVVTFAPHNLTRDPPFSRIDLVSCRNLLIYLQPELQRVVLGAFHYALVPNGILALGKSETVAPLGGAFRTVSHGARVYRRAGRAPLPAMPQRLSPLPPPAAATPLTHTPAGPDYGPAVRAALGELHASNAVLTNRDGHALYFHGPLRRYVEQPQGAPTADLFALLDGALRPQVRAAMHRALAERRAVQTVAAVPLADGEQPLRVDVTPLAHPTADDLLLITFEEIERKDAGTAVVNSDAHALRQLEDELRSTKRELRGAIEELETANEELKVANEEAMSNNEELQSTNEELETSQEELQSVNEELTTVNHQLQAKLEELEQTNDDLSNLLASTSIPTLFLDREMRVKRFTPAATRVFSLIGSDLNRPLTDIASQDDTAAVVADARAVLETLTPLERETATRDGRHYLRRTLPYRTQEDRIDGVVITLTEVTELKSAAQGLQRLAAVMRDASDAIVVHALDGRIVDWNRGAQTMYGYSAEQALQRRIADLLPPDQRAAYEADMKRVLAGESLQGTDARRLKHDGSELHVAASMSVIRDDAGRAQAISLIERDITPRKVAEARLRESEHRFRTLADNAPVLIWMADDNGVLRFANRSFADFTGAPVERLTGMPLADLLHRDDRSRAAGALAALRGGDAHDGTRLRLRHQDGAYRWVQCTAMLKPDAVSGDAAIVGSMMDIDDQVHAEQLLREASRSKDEFLAMLGHELRNPLAPIRNAAEVLRRVAPDDQRLTWVHDVLVRQVGHVTRLVDDLLDISTITRGTMQLRVEPVDLVPILARAVDDLEPALKRKRQQFKSQLPAEPLWVEGDKIRLQQVFNNLLGNSAKYTDEGGHIGLSAHREDGHVVVRVDDDGMGIAPEMQPRIFDLFVQDQRSIDRSQGGLGIGLALVRHLVEKHGGTVQAHSPGLGRGSEFVVRLPRLREVPVADSADDAAGAAPSDGRVLIVDDDRESGDSLRVLLELDGFQVESAADLHSALAAAARLRPQVVVMDIAMPQADGYELARRMRALPEIGPGLQVIGLSGFGRTADFERSRAENFAHHFAKPVEPLELERVIRELLAAQAAGTAPPGER